MLSEAATDLLVHHPGLVIVETEDEVTLQGSVKIKEKIYNINLRCPHFPKIKDFKLAVRHEHRVLRFKESTASNIGSLFTDNKSDMSVAALIDNLPLFTSEVAFDKDNNIENKTAAMNSNHKITNNNKNNEGIELFYAEIISLHKPEKYDIQMNSTCTLLRFCKFALNERHYLEIELPSLKVRAHSLPDCLKWPDIHSKLESLTAIVSQFEKIIEDLQPFYECFNGIDELCHVVQPAKPTTKHNYRIFVLHESTHVFLKLIITDPFSPMASMFVHIIGPTAEVEKLRHIYSEGLKDWDSELDIQKNLLRIFDLCYFPMPPDTGENEEGEICNICYSYRLESVEESRCDVPIVSCDNLQCTLVFHETCLIEWFNTKSENVAFLNVAFGNCPFCKAKLSKSFEQLQTE